MSDKLIKNKKLVPIPLIIIFSILILILILSFFPLIRDFIAKTVLGFSGETINKDYFNLLIAIFGIVGLFGNFFIYLKRLIIQNQLIVEQQTQNKTLSTQITNQENQLKLQFESNLDQRFASAIETLGNLGESARTGAIYSLYHLASEHEKYRQTVIDILCSHIATITREAIYQKNNQKEPSIEIQTIIDLLFKENGIYYLHYKKLNNPKLKSTFLRGADFSKSFCHFISFYKSDIAYANFKFASCVKCNFNNTYLLETDFMLANLFSSNIEESKCYKTCFRSTIISSCSLNKSYCIGCDLSNAICIESDTTKTNFLGCNFHASTLLETYFEDTHFEGSSSKKNINHLKELLDTDTIMQANIFYTLRSDQKDKMVKFFRDSFRMLGPKRKHIKSDIELIRNNLIVKRKYPSTKPAGVVFGTLKKEMIP
jgi:uncharacterized protein YjbI with pentapeptide repeats